MKKTPQQRGRDFEKEIARRVEGTLTPSSGALWGSKLDVRTNDYLISCKYTEKKSFSIKASDLKELKKYAEADDRYSAFVFKLEDSEIWIAEPFSNGNWVFDQDD